MAEQLQIETKELAKDNTELISTYDKQLEQIKLVIDELEKLKKQYEAAEKAAKNAATEAYNYWHAASNEAASTDTTINSTKVTETKKPTNTAPKVTAPSLSVGSSISVKSGTRWYEDSYGGGNSGPASGGQIVLINTKGTHPYNIG